MKEIYILATARPDPVELDELRHSYESEDVEFVTGEDGCLFSIRNGQLRIDVRFDRRDGMVVPKELLTGSEEAVALLQSAKGLYRISFEPGKPQPSVAVFEALWCARSLMEHVDGVLLDLTAYRLHEEQDVVEITELDFDIRDHVSLHAVEAASTDTPLWVHSHGMEKFAARDVEVFHLSADDLAAAETFFHELCTDLAFGQGIQPRTKVGTSAGASFMLLPSEEARLNLFGISPETFEGHEGLYLTVVSPDGRHNVSELLEPYRERFEEESPQEAEALSRQASALLPAFKARFLRKGLMEPLTFLVRAPFEVHVDGETKSENLWVEVLAWDDDSLVGKLIEGSQHTTEWRKGSHVEITDDSINALSMAREGRTLEEEEMRALLDAERPA